MEQLRLARSMAYQKLTTIAPNETPPPRKVKVVITQSEKEWLVRVLKEQKEEAFDRLFQSQNRCAPQASIEVDEYMLAEACRRLARAERLKVTKRKHAPATCSFCGVVDSA
jgi:hypothetical protein